MLVFFSMLVFGFPVLLFDVAITLLPLEISIELKIMVKKNGNSQTL